MCVAQTANFNSPFLPGKLDSGAFFTLKQNSKFIVCFLVLKLIPEMISQSFKNACFLYMTSKLFPC